MRLKKGSKVEVFCHHEKPAGSWRCAEIISGNGHNYTVRYDMDEFNESVEERVSRKLLRPSPPPVVLSENWRPGDVVEVLHNFSWKMATVSKVLARGKFLVRLVGSSNEFEVRKFDIRMRQSWVDDRWAVIGKVLVPKSYQILSSLNYSDRDSNQRLTMKYSTISRSQVNGSNSNINIQEKHGHVIGEKNFNFNSSNNVSSRSLKRDSPYCSQAEAYRQKLRAVERDGKYHPVIVESFCQLPENVVNNAFRGKVLGKTAIPSFASNRKWNCSTMDETRIKRNGAVGFSALITAKPNDVSASSSCSSIGSNNPFNCPRGLVLPGEDAEDHSSDAESVCCSYEEERNSLLFTKEEMAAEIHRLELHAYRCTMEALHASGPLSWEQETLITNLRISLHISNDEHLMELRNLISNSSSMPN